MYWPHSDPNANPPETPCATCAERPALTPSYMCGACFNKLRADISTLVGAYVWLGVAMLATGVRPTEGTISRTAESRIPFRVDLHDKREEIAATLAYWTRMIAEAHTPALAGPADGDVETVGRWLRARLPWVSEQEACVTMATELAATARSAYALVPWNARRRDFPLTCPGCRYLTLSLYGADEVIMCRNRDCGRVLSWADYWEEVRKRQPDLSQPLDPHAFQGTAA